ncbi:MAG: TolB-like 6-bladed beta-propeller domain-containing protein [Candidatus Aminicenantes bacterium]|nr:TolB-like 6-bladed beta-propeller domain-containing protein [Candidatus Aminicenantes bacterium]
MMNKTARVAGSRTWASVLLALLAVTALASGQLVENPAKPAAKNAGRILQLTEVWKITDDGGEFFFKYPNNLQIAEDGSIFVVDADEFLKFSPDGKFLRNIFKKGQGPGEIEDFFYYFVHGHDLFIWDPSSQRFWRADFDGVFQEQINLANKNYSDFLGVLPDGFLFLKAVWPPFEDRTGKLMEILHTVALVARDGSERRDVATFKPRRFLPPQGAMAWDSSIIVPSPDAKLLYAFHSRDYLIEVVDLAAGAIIKRFKRIYPKVPYVERGWEPGFRNKYGAPKIEYEIDVNSLYPVGDRLWVETSTDDKTKGRLFDVFDKDGRFLDSFYLGAGRTLMAVREDAVFCREKNEDETITIVKYRIE